MFFIPSLCMSFKYCLKMLRVMKKNQDRDYYSLHLSGKNFNFRLLMAFDEKDTPKFLVAFYERAGKKKTDYTQYKKVLDSRFEEV